MGDGKETKGASDRHVRAHIRRVLKKLLPKGGEKKKDAGDRRERLHMVARVVAASLGGGADGPEGTVFSGKMFGLVPGRGSLVLP